jgi:hypothetical protein
MDPWSEGETHDRSFGRQDPGNYLTPGFGASGMKQRVSGRLELLRSTGDSVCVLELELDADLRDRCIGGPVGSAEAGLSRFRERPHAEVLAAFDVLTGVVVAIKLLERETRVSTYSFRLSAGSGAITLTLAMN